MFQAAEYTFKMSQIHDMWYDQHKMCTLKSFVTLFRMKIPNYVAKKNPNAGQTLIIDKSTKDIRPHCVAAVLRNVKFTKER